jgi:hypothetical protein
VKDYAFIKHSEKQRRALHTSTKNSQNGYQNQQTTITKHVEGELRHMMYD